MIFSIRLQRVIIHLTRAVLGLEAGMPDADLVWVPVRIAEYVGTLAWAPRLLFRAITWYFEWRGCLCVRGGLRPFTRMSPAQRRAYLATWLHAHSPLRRVLMHFASGMIAMNYYAAPEAAAWCGYTPNFGHALPRPPLPRADTATAVETRGKIFTEPPMHTPHTMHADIVVVGSGAGGAVMASALARAGRDVLVLEEGGLHDASQYRGDFFAATRDTYRESGATTTLGFPPILVPHGRCIGGTTVINSGSMLEVPDAVLHVWRERFGLHDWSHATLDPYFAEIRRQLHIHPVPDALQGPHARIFARGAAARGYTMHPLPRNAADCAGSGTCCFGCPTNAKVSMALSLLPDALAHDARILANCTVQRLRRNGDRITAVEASWNGQPVLITANTVVLSAGTFRTPLLLHRSRVPDPSHHNGRHLTLHPAVKVVAEMAESVQAWRGVPQGMYSEDLKHAGVTIESIFLPPPHMAFALITRGQKHRALMERYNHLAAFGAMISDTSEGRLFFVGGYPIPWYRINRTDLKKYHAALCFLADVFLAAGADAVHLPLHRLRTITKRSGLVPLQRHRVSRLELDLQGFHPLGTCRMAADPHDGVVDGTGRVHTMQNLYIADGSLFPTALGVNPQVTIMAAAYKIAAGLP